MKAEKFIYDIFFSYSYKDKSAVSELATKLKQDGLNVWLDEWIIKPGDSIQQEIEEGLNRSRIFILVMSENVSSSEWSEFERYTFQYRDPINQERRFIPIRFDHTPIPNQFKQFAYIDFTNKDQEEYEHLLNLCKSFQVITNYEENSYDHPISGDFYIKPVCNTVNMEGTQLLIGGASGRIALIDIESQKLLLTFKPHEKIIWSIKFSPDGRFGIAGSVDHTITVFDLSSGEILHCWSTQATTWSIDVTKDGSKIVASLANGEILIFDMIEGTLLETLSTGEKSPLYCTVISSDGQYFITGGKDGLLRIWNLKEYRLEATLSGHTNAIRDVTITHDMKLIISGSKDKTIRIWDFQKQKLRFTFEGHTSAIKKLTLSQNGIWLLSTSSREIILWDIIASVELKRLHRKETRFTPSAVFAADNQTIIFPTDKKSFQFFDISKCTLAPDIKEFSRYTNAKVLLVGDSGVGKSGLAIRLTENKFKHTISTDAHWVTQLKLSPEFNTNELDREVWLWDFAGQSDYRLMHQLFMDETSLAILVFNPQSQNLFEVLNQWDRDLMRAARKEFVKILVAGRIDRGGLMISRELINDFTKKYGYANYLETSALNGLGCEELRNEIIDRIDWNSIPWTASPRIFKILKDEILRLRDEGIVLLRMSELKQQLDMRLINEVFTIEELDAIVSLLAGPGYVRKLEFGDVVILQPEWINKYAAAVIRSIRANIGEIGVIDEAKILSGDLNYTLDVSNLDSDELDTTLKPEMQRLEISDEIIILRAMQQMFVDYGLCVREELEGGGRQLIFPSYFKKELPADPGYPPVLVKYQFDGHAEEIYATLVVQLWHTKAFENGELWRYAVDFKSVTGARLGFKMTKSEDMRAEISVYFDQKVQDDTKVTFIKYIHEHLLQKAKNVVRLRAFICPHCQHPVHDTELARDILNEEGQAAEIRCQQRKCDKLFPLWDIIEQKFASEEFQERVRQLEELAKIKIDNESRELIIEGHTKLITEEAGQIYYRYTGSDHGIDGEIEFKNDRGEASGKRLYLQLKSGDSYSYERKKDGKEIFKIKNESWAEYWQSKIYPVMLVIRTSDNEIRWMDVSKYLKEKSKIGKVTEIEFEGQLLSPVNILNFRGFSLPNNQQTESKESYMKKSLPTVVILTAIQEEYNAVKKHLHNIKDADQNNTAYEVGIFIFNGIEIAKVIIRECGARNTTAAQESERAIQYFRPNCMFFVGIAGSRKPNDFAVGDVIFPEKIYSYEGGKSEEHTFKARPDTAGISYSLIELAKKERRKNDWKVLIKNKWEKDVKANLGIIASGDQIIEHYNSSIGKILTDYFNDTSAVEMEGFGFANAAARQGQETNNILVGIVRGISDIIGQPQENISETQIDRRPDNVKDFASDTAAAFTFWLIYKSYEGYLKTEHIESADIYIRGDADIDMNMRVVEALKKKSLKKQKS